VTEQDITPGGAVAVMRILGDEVKAKTTDVRESAKEHFREVRAKGTKSMVPQLPSGAEVGRITITDPSPVVKWDGPALLRYVEVTAPTEVVDKVNPDVLADPELVLWVLQNRPDMVRSEVRDAYRDRLRKKLTDDGELVDETSGQLIKVATVERTKSDGSFSYTPSDDAREQVLDAWRSGELVAMGGLFSALGAPAAPAEVSVEQVDAEEADQ
jgi:hypothetical protein